VPTTNIRWRRQSGSNVPTEKQSQLLFAALPSLAAKASGQGRLLTITLFSQQMPTSGRNSAGKDTGGPLSRVQAAFLKMERELVEFGDAHHVRVVIMRIADRVYGQSDSALKHLTTSSLPSSNPCRVEQCGDDEPITRIHSEDLSLVLRRMLSMFDIVETHSKDSSMRGTAAMDKSLSRFPSGTVLEVVDDAPAQSMLKAKLVVGIITGISDACQSSCADITGDIPEAMRAHRNAKGRNADLKQALGMPQLRYPTFHHGASKMFGTGEL